MPALRSALHAWTALPLAALLLLAGCPTGDDDDSAVGDDDDSTAATWVLGEVIDTEGKGTLARMDGSWGGDLWVIRVEGSNYEMGYQYGRLLGQKMLDIWWTFIGDIGSELGASDPEDADFLVGNMLDQAWLQFEPHTDPGQLELIEGIGDGMVAAELEYGDGDEDLRAFVHRVLSMAEFAISTHMSGDDIIGLSHLLESGYADELLDYYGVDRTAAPTRTPAHGAEDLRTAWELLSDPTVEDDGEDTIFNCSTYAAWGERTEGGALLGTRNMDFSSDTGIHAFANVAAFVPDDGVPWVSVSWAGLSLGGLAAINQHGVTVGHAEAATPLERLATECGVLKSSRVMQHATDLDSALAIMGSAPTMGVTGMVSWGDPLGGGADAQAAAFEQNGASFAVHHNRHDCSTETTLYRYDYEGDIESTMTHLDDPQLANLERDAVEVDGDGQTRWFACVDPCATMADLVTDGDGRYVEVAGPQDGMAIPTGHALDCAVYRGDSAFAHGVRMHQKASHGPMSGDGSGLMIDAGAYNDRYTPQFAMTEAYAAGTAYSHDGVEVVADNGGTPVVIGLDEVEQISRVAGMDSSNVWNAVWDATNLVLRLSYESGSGDSWVAAKDQPDYLEIDLDDLFLTD